MRKRKRSWMMDLTLVLPPEIVFKIITQYLDPKDVVLRFNTVCKRWREMGTDEMVWRSFYRQLISTARITADQDAFSSVRRKMLLDKIQADDLYQRTERIYRRARRKHRTLVITESQRRIDDAIRNGRDSELGIILHGIDYYSASHCVGTLSRAISHGDLRCLHVVQEWYDRIRRQNRERLTCFGLPDKKVTILPAVRMLSPHCTDVLTFLSHHHRGCDCGVAEWVRTKKGC